ncbi:MAG: sugar ABC transporter permease [Lachnospiraceae bacterium]|nr:sugar ABC transporter permease [Lachnospiraceae bacterium]
MEIETKYKLFLMLLPFLALVFAFSYLPLFSWRYAFFDYSAGSELTMDNFVGLKWFKLLVQSPAYVNRLLRVLRNTLALSFLGIVTSWVPMFFAIFLSEARSAKFKRFVQVFSTIPNFISWVLVYAIAFAIFNTDGFINTLINSLGGNASANYLQSPDHMWLKMLAWGMWKGVGWSAIIYISGIAGIDQQLYEAATVDGAGRFHKMRYITIPGLLPTFVVLLVMSIAGILSNGMDQYLVFTNANNKDLIEVLDLYVYNLGIGSGSIPLSTVVGMTKSIISVVLLFIANSLSKLIRGDSVV